MLAIAGSDPSGGAGIQADLKSIAAHGGYGMAAITALTAQNTRGVRAVHVPPAAFLTAQLDAVSADIGIDAVKIGMLGDATVIDAVRRWLEQARPAVVVLDPVMVATSGDRLLPETAETALHALLPLADLVTPNLAELAMLLREPVAADWAEALAQGKRLAALTGTTVLVKGGHLWRTGDGATTDAGGCPDALVNTGGTAGPGDGSGAGPTRAHAQQPRHRVLAVLGAGDRAGPGGGLGGRPPRRSSPGWKVRCGPRSSLDVGTGNGPVHHFHHVQHLTADPDEEVRRTVPAEGEFVAALGAARRRTSTRSTAWSSSAAWPTARCRKRLRLLPRPGRPLPQRLLAGAGPRQRAMAPSEAEQLFWARSAQQCLEVESELHRTWLSTRPVRARPGPGHQILCGPSAGGLGRRQLRGAGCGRPALLLAVCRGRSQAPRQFLAAGAPAAHPYAGWLRTYADEDFAAATRQAIAVTDACGTPGIGGRAGRHDTGLQAVVPLRSRFLRRAAAARLTGRPRRACTIVGHGSGSCCRSTLS